MIRSADASSPLAIQLRGASKLVIAYRATGELKLDPRNPRRHSPRQVRQIARSIEAFGFNVPVLIDRTQRGCRGHGRLTRRSGDILHPERESRETLAIIRRTVGEYNFASQYQQSPAPLGGGMVKEAWFKRYAPEALPATGRLPALFSRGNGIIPHWAAHLGQRTMRPRDDSAIVQLRVKLQNTRSEHNESASPPIATG